MSESRNQGTGLPRSIVSTLEAVRAHVGRIGVLQGLVYLVAGVLGWHVGSMILDRLLELPKPFRAVLLVGAAIGAVVLVARQVIQPAGRARALTDDEAALFLERQFDLDEELISAVQLARSPENQRVAHSNALIQKVVEGAGERVKPLDVRKVLSSSPLWRTAGLTAVAVGFVAFLGLSQPKSLKIWWNRNVLLADELWPREVDLRVTFEPAGGVVAMGDALVVKAEVLRGAPKRVELQTEFMRSEEEDERAMLQGSAAQQQGIYRATIENMSEPVRLRVVGGDFKSQVYEIEVRPRPTITDVRVWVRYPEYTGLVNTPKGEPLRDGNLRVPAGSQVQLEVEATESLSKAQLTFDDAGALGNLDGLSVEGALARGSFTVLKDTRYRIVLTSSAGFESRGAARFTIDAVPDRLPGVRFAKPGRTKTVTPTARVPITMDFEDDYRLTGAQLVYEVKRQGEQDPEPEVRVALSGFAEAITAGESGGQKASLAHEFEVRGTASAPGDEITYWAEAVDSRIASGDVASATPETRGRSRSSYKLLVRQPLDVERELQRRLKQVRDDLVAASRMQRKLRDDVDGARNQLARKQPLTPEQKRALTYAEMDQRRLGQRIERAGDAFESVREEMAWNEVGKEEDQRWLTELEETVDRTVGGVLAEAIQELAKARQAETPDAKGLMTAVRRQDEVLAALDDIVKRLDKWDEFNEVLRELNDLRKVQDEVRESTRDEAKKDLGDDNK
ncbi:MAG: coiled-coil domain-containing protein [Planctomycetota bacterium]